MPLSERAKNVLLFINGFRKFLVMTILIIVGVSFRLTGYLSGVEMVDLLSGVAIAFMSANSVEHLSKSVIEWLKSKKGQ